MSWKDAIDHPLFKKYENDEVDNAASLFGGLGAQASMVAKQEFENNRLKKNDVNEKVLTDDELFKQNQQIRPTKLEESPVDLKQNNPMKNQMLSKEVYFRYCHEFNKVLLLVWFAKKQQTFIKNNLLPSSSESLVNTSFLMLIKASIINSAVLNAL